MYEELRAQARQAAEELVGASKIKAGQILVVGCSSSEIGGEKIGSNSSPEVAEAGFYRNLGSAEGKGNFPGGAMLRASQPGNYFGEGSC